MQVCTPLVKISSPAPATHQFAAPHQKLCPSARYLQITPSLLSAGNDFGRRSFNLDATGGGSRKICTSQVRAAVGSSSSASSPAVHSPKSGVAGALRADDERVKQIFSVQELDEALIAAKNKLVVVEYAASHSINSRRIYPAMVELSKSCHDVVFLLVLGDESDGSRDLCIRAEVETVPHFIFYKNKAKIHEEQGISEDTLLGDVLYYGDNDAPIFQIHTKDDYKRLLYEHASDHKLVVLDVGLKNCGPCVKVYPTVVRLSRQMAGSTIFARMNGDENDDLMELLKKMNVVEVPTFLFIRDGKLLGRYVGSGKGELVGEILRYNGVQVT